MNSESQCMWNQTSHCLAAGKNGTCYTQQQLQSGVCNEYGTAGNQVVGLANTFANTYVKFVEELNKNFN